MAWLQIDDNVPLHRKMLMAGPSACWLWVCAIAYCQRQITDGFVPELALPMLDVRGAKRLVGVLVSVGLLERVDGGYRVVKTPLVRFMTSERPHLRPLLPDLIALWGDACVYCGVDGVPLEIEHIVPRSRGGSDDPSNLTLACQSCNSKKGTKTASEFGFPHIHEQAKGVQ